MTRWEILPNWPGSEPMTDSFASPRLRGARWAMPHRWRLAAGGWRLAAGGWRLATQQIKKGHKRDKLGGRAGDTG
jgi:hypothetical protein